MDSLFFFRPVRSTDVPELLNLVSSASGGLSSLQPRKDFMSDYVAKAEESFSGKLPIDAPHKYLMALIDVDSGKLIGCSAVKTCIGTDTPFINFDVVGDGVDQYLLASSRFTGATEVGSLFLDKDFRTSGLGRYLAKVRYLLMAAEPWRFGDLIIAELRGMCGAQGSPLYDYLFKEKLEQTFLEADAEYFDRNPDALGDIVPIGPISTADMPVEVRASLGQPHPSGGGALRLLQKEGFLFSRTIDLFDGGPIMSAFADTIRTRMNSKIATVASGEGKDTLLVSAGNVSQFRACVCTGGVEDDTIYLQSRAHSILQIKPGDTVRYWRSVKSG